MQMTMASLPMMVGMIVALGIFGSSGVAAIGLRGRKAVEAETQLAWSTAGGSSTEAAAGMKAHFERLAQEVLHGDAPDMQVHKLLSEAAKQKMHPKDALKRLEGKLPADIASLASLTASGACQGKACPGDASFDEASLQRARRILNNMVKDAVKEMDDVSIECHEFASRNRETYTQVRSDLAFFGSELSKLDSERVENIEGIQEANREWGETFWTRMLKNWEYSYDRYLKQNELTVRKNDLAVWDFILEITECPVDASTGLPKPNCSALAQVESSAHIEGGCRAKKADLCAVGDSFRLRINDKTLQAKMERMLTSDARKALRQALSDVAEHPHAQSMLLQTDQERMHRDNTTTTTLQLNGVIESEPVIDGPDPQGQWRKCTNVPFDCGMLNDLMARQWGTFRDLVDDLEEQMRKEEEEHIALDTNLNLQLTEIGEKKTGHMTGLGHTISSINVNSEAEGQKDEERLDLDSAFHEKMRECTIKLTDLAFTHICAVRSTRNSVMDHSTTSPPEDIVDCDVTDWVPDRCEDHNGNELTCDDSCPQTDPLACGGYRTIRRSVLVNANEYGIQCPGLEREMKCNQHKCPIDCSTSEWSGFSECTKECGSGEELQTRSVLTQPANGGEVCDSLEDVRACHTESCDRDCTLEDWTGWSPCSMACSMDGFTGLQERNRHVLVPIRANGKCPRDKSHERYEEQQCNTHTCIGDEICIAQQDLIIALDGSGSAGYDGFEAMKAFAANLTLKYQAEYFGQMAMKIGVIVFGQGRVLENKTVTPAINLLPLSDDMTAVKDAIEGAPYQGGFTNMAQALALADVMLQSGRADAQSAVMVISDGQFAMPREITNMANALKDKNAMVYMVPISEVDSEGLEHMKEFASQPWETNYERIAGLKALEFNSAIFAQRIVVKFCPQSFSPSLMRQQEEEKLYMEIHANGWPSYNCGQWIWLGYRESKEDCAIQAREHNKLAFSFGRHYASGACYAEAVSVTQDEWNTWSENRRHPACPNGYWIYNPYYDTFALKPE